MAVVSGPATPGIPDSWLSATLDVSHGGVSFQNNLPAGCSLRLTLTPRGPLLDGSAGRTLTRDLLLYHWRDIPIGVYTATATLIGPSGGMTALPLRVVAGGPKRHLRPPRS